MRRQSNFYNKASFNFGKNSDGFETRIPCTLPSLPPHGSRVTWCFVRAEIPSSIKTSGRSLDSKRPGCGFGEAEIISMAYEKEEVSDEDDELCPVDCVKEFKTDEEFSRMLEKAKETNSLVVVDFYRTSCGSCKYIEQGFAKLCKGAGDEEAAVVFLKHNVSINCFL